MIDPKDAFKQGAELSSDDVRALEEAGISGTVRIGNLSADFLSLHGESFHVSLTSAGVWLGVTTEEEDYVMFVEQKDRLLSDGQHPWEVPSGGVDLQRDTNIYGTLIREVGEETGVTLTNALPIAVAVKREQEGIPETIIVPTADNEIWIHNEEQMRELAQMGNLDGGLICISRITLDNFQKTRAQILDKTEDGTMFFAPPQGVDSAEISRIALEPLDKIIEGNSQFVSRTSHMWAQADAFRAFMLKLHSGQQ